MNIQPVNGSYGCTVPEATEINNMKEEEIPTYEEAKEAKKVLIDYLTKDRRLSGYDGEDTWGRYNTEYLVLLALNQNYFLD